MPYLANHFLRGVGTYCIDQTAMTADCQDKIVLFGDSLTQMSWDPEYGGIGARLASTSGPIGSYCSLDRYISMTGQRRRFVCA
jgi:hypothetical protein